MTLKTSDLGVNDFLFLMEYVVNKKITSDYEAVNTIMENCNMQHDQELWNWTNFGVYGDVQVKKFKNGKVIFKGLSKEQYSRLAEIFELVRR